MFQKGHTYIVSSGQVKFKFLLVILLVSLLAGIPGLAADVTDVRAAGNNIERLSVSDNGTQGNNRTLIPDISNDGRYVTFGSIASNLVPNDVNNFDDVFVYDRETGTIARVSIASNGAEANSASDDPKISGDGRYVVFQSWAGNLAPDDANNHLDVFVHDRQTNTTSIVSMSDNGTAGNNNSYMASINDDGRYVAFRSLASNLVPSDTNGAEDVFVRDLQTGITILISVSDNGTKGNDDSYNPNISDDGQYVAFESRATNLVPNDANSCTDIFIRDRQANTTSIISVSDNGTQGNGGSEQPCLSSDGRYVAFRSVADNLVPDDSNYTGDVFLRDRQANTTTRINIASGGSQGNLDSGQPTISGDGRYIAFESWSSNLVPNDTNFTGDIFVRDRQTNSIALVSLSNNGTQGNGPSSFPALNIDGKYIVFFSDASNLVPNDTNGSTDVFVATNPLYEELPPNIPPPPPIPIPTLPSPHVSPALPPQLNQAQISLQYLSVNPQQAQVNQPLTIAGNVVNTGDQAGNYNLALKINGHVEQTRMVSVGPQASQSVKFSVTKSEPGIYTIDIGGQRETFTVLGKSPGKSSTSNNNLIILAAMGMLALVAVVLFVSRRTS